MSLTILWNGHRKSVSIVGNSPMSKVLNDACIAHGFSDCQKFDLVHKKNVIDLSQPFRLTGIPPNSTLELSSKKRKMKGSQVRVGVKLPNGEMLQDMYASDVTLDFILCDILIKNQKEKFEISSAKVQFMRCSYDNLSSTTLDSMGIVGGSAMLTISGLKESEVPLTIPQSTLQFKATNNEKKNSLENEIEKENDSVLENEKNSMDIETIENETFESLDSSKMSALDGDKKLREFEVGNEDIQSSNSEENTSKVGADFCAKALDKITSLNFDEDALECLKTMLKYIDGLIKHPENAHTRSIRLSNKVFSTNIGSVDGGIDFFKGMGFETKFAEDALDHEINLNPTANTILFLDAKREDPNLVLKAREMIIDKMHQIGVELKSLKPPVPIKAQESYELQNFDPYKSNLVSWTKPSNTATKLNELIERKNLIEAISNDESFDRCVTVKLSSSAIEVDADLLEHDDAKQDNAIIAQRIARQQQQRKREEEIPFQTKAMRTIRNLERSKVYTFTIIKVVLPDRSVIQAKFRPKEGISAVAEFIRSCLHDSIQEKCQFQLYVTPPRTLLKNNETLGNYGLVPAAVVYLSWAPSTKDALLSVERGKVMGDCLRDDLVSSNKRNEMDECYPTGIALNNAESERKGDFERNKVSDKKKNSNGSAKGSGKPKWLKI